MNKNTCISCLEEIKPEAKKCPHCYQVQSVLYSLKTNIKLLWPLLGVFILVLSYAFYQELSFDPKVRKHQAPIINNVKLVSIDNNSGPFITCFGHIKNPIDKRVKNIILQAKFFNNSGDEIDLINHKLEMSLKGNMELDFKISNRAAHNIENYNSCTIDTLTYY